MPLESPYVREMLDREFTIAVWNRPQVFLWLKRAGRYFPHIEKELAEAGMPDDLKYLAVAESNLLTYVRSPKGAVGTWQFMAETGKRYGLRKDRSMDERRNFERSTEAAISYLRELKDIFGAWTLALAAYNCGEALLERAMETQRVRDYYALNLPLETERFIFRIAAIKVIMKHPERYGYKLPPDHVYRPIRSDRITVQIDIPLHIMDLARTLRTDFKVIKELNPQILGDYFPRGHYAINVPKGYGSKMAGIFRRLGKSASGSRHEKHDGHAIVQPGDTLSHIAERTGVPVAKLKKLNGISGSLIRVGQKLKLVH
jgi:hypothetical protein